MCSALSEHLGIAPQDEEEESNEEKEEDRETENEEIWDQRSTKHGADQIEEGKDCVRAGFSF